MTKTLARAKAKGEIRPDTDIHLAAEFLLTTLNGLKVNARAGMPAKRLQEVGNLALQALGGC